MRSIEHNFTSEDESVDHSTSSTKSDSGFVVFRENESAVTSDADEQSVNVDKTTGDVLNYVTDDEVWVVEMSQFDDIIKKEFFDQWNTRFVAI